LLESDEGQFAGGGGGDSLSRFHRRRGDDGTKDARHRPLLKIAVKRPAA
jgi:hypothetical protein